VRIDIGFAAMLVGDSVAADSRIGPAAVCMGGIDSAAVCRGIDSAAGCLDCMDIDFDTVAGGSGLALNLAYPMALDSKYFFPAAGAAMCTGDSRQVGAFDQSLVPAQIPGPAIPVVRASTSNRV
jgi:hypothetical protein